MDCGGPCAACPPPTATATTPKAPTKIVYAHVQGLTLSQLLRTVGTRRLYYGTAKAVIVDSANKPIAGAKVSFKFVHSLTKTPADLPVVASATTTYVTNAGIGSVSIDRSLWVCVTGITSLSTTATTRVYYVPSKNTVTCVSGWPHVSGSFSGISIPTKFVVLYIGIPLYILSVSSQPSLLYDIVISVSCSLNLAPAA